MNNMSDPFSDLMLDEEERLLESRLEKGEFEEVSDLTRTKKMLEEAAEPHAKSHTKPVTLRINQL
jgi:hypothetical protein